MRRNRQLLVLWVGWLLLASLGYSAENYQIDADHTTVGFAVKHLTISTVKGDFKKFSGTILLDEKDLSKSSVKVEIDPMSIDTANQKRDDHLRGDDFFATQKYPKMTFVSKKVYKKGDDWMMRGNLTMRGVTKQVEFPFTLSGPVMTPWGTSNIGIEAGLTIDRQDWGMKFDKTFDKGGLVVGNEVKISLNVEAIKPPPAKKPEGEKKE